MRDMGVSLILEGGGARCAFTAGVLDYFLEKKLTFPLTIGVSAGAFVGINYISKQYKRILSVVLNKSYMDLRKDSETTDNVLNMFDFLTGLDSMLTELDFDEFSTSKFKFLIPATDANSGDLIFLNANKSENRSSLFKMVSASCANPIFSKPVTIDHFNYFSSGCSDRLPIIESLRLGYKRSVVVMTRKPDFLHKPYDITDDLKDRLKNYPNVLDVMRTNHRKYTDSKTILDFMAYNDDAVIIYPKNEVIQNSFDLNYSRILIQYNEGYKCAKETYINIKNLLNKKEDWYG
ncbi:patatin-like phospholipase family protein [Microaceticoccus formicicus]|uniref:patatin-like phospholipase family protein n=1 Tax=Microaceticoccus formicicus TaxID=3118105 RepID=UPI003CD03F29|nr:patatin family protein [Peptoniphilaceae bacterium AMB_02]